MSEKALFLDRDGVINHDPGYTHKIDGFKFIDGIFDLCRYAKSLGYLIFIVTNQGGIAKGIFQEEDFNILSSWLKQRFEEEGAPIKKIYHCPHNFKDGTIAEFKIDCNCRKPKPGLILQAISEFDIDPKQSILIGDKESDIEAGIAANIRDLLLLSNASSQSKATKIITNLQSAKEYMR
ncbi:HAD family hydrolase [Rickettsiales bacterium]|nr:HAD family hydrolase [Rickettsiales bacterium]